MAMEYLPIASICASSSQLVAFAPNHAAGNFDQLYANGHCGEDFLLNNEREWDGVRQARVTLQ